MNEPPGTPQSPEPPRSPPSPLARNFFDRILYAPDRRLRPILRAALFFLPAFLLTQWIDSATLSFLASRASLLIIFTIARGASAVVLLALSWIFLEAFDRRRFHTLGIWFYPRWPREILWGAAFGALLMGLTAAVLFAQRGIEVQGANLRASAIPINFLRAALLFLFAAAMEEVLFRGYLFQRLIDSLGPWGAVALMSACFGASHILNPAANALSTANTILAGILLSLAYLRTRALWLPIGLHWSWNFVQGQILSLPVSGLQFWNPLLRANAAGPTWFTGGSYGPEGGLALTCVCLAGILWLARTKRLSPSQAMQEVLQ